MRKLKIVVPAALALLLVAVLVVFWLMSGSAKNESANSNKTSNQPSASNMQMSADDESRFESALNSTDRNQQASIMTPELNAAYLAQNQSMLPDGGKVDLRPDTMTSSGNAAYVQADITAGGATNEYWLTLVRTDETSPWLLVNTERK